MYIPKTTWTWAFMITTFCQTAVVLAIEIYVFARFQANLIKGQEEIAQVKTIPTYLTLFIFGFIYQVVLVWDSLRLKNTIQVIGLCLYNLGMLIYAAIQFDQVDQAIQNLQAHDPVYIPKGDPLWKELKPYLLAVPCIIAFFTLAMSFIAWKLYDEFAWTIYKHISADLRMKRRFLTFQIYITLLKFDFFFFLGFTVQFLVIVTKTDAELGLTIAAVPITILILIMASFWTRRENKFGMVFTIILFICGLAYFIFKLTRMYSKSHESSYLLVRKNLASFAGITILLIVLTIINAIVCMMNFGKGLKQHVMKRNLGDEDQEKLGPGGMDNMTELPNLKPGHVPASSRMTID